MKSLRSFLRSLPMGLRHEFVTRHAAERAEAVDWNAGDGEVLRELTLALTASQLQQQQVQVDVERICALADEAGEAAMQAVSTDRAELEALPGNTARALFLFLHNPVHFRRAEEIRYTDEHRRGRMWSGFVGPQNRPLSVNPEATDRLKQLLRARFGSEKIHIEVFERGRIGNEGEEYRLLQMTIYREGWPNQVLEFEGDELQERSRRPVYEAAVTYEPNSGSVEVVARDKQAREDLASIFNSEILGATFSREKLPLRHYDLFGLKIDHVFPFDTEDRIEKVRVTMLRLMPLDTTEQRLVLETLSGSKETIWQMADRRLGAGNPLRGSWLVTQAKLTIHFHPEPGAGRGRTLPIVITMPHGCDLKDRTARERVVGQKYLSRWGLLKDAEA